MSVNLHFGPKRYSTLSCGNEELFFTYAKIPLKRYTINQIKFYNKEHLNNSKKVKKTLKLRDVV